MNYIVVPGIKEVFRIQSAPKITPEYVIKHVCEYYGIQPEKLKTGNRSKELVDARHVVFYILRRNTNITLKEAGLLFNRDHTTVIHGLEKLSDLMDTEPNTKAAVEFLESEIK